MSDGENSGLRRVSPVPRGLGSKMARIFGSAASFKVRIIFINSSLDSIPIITVLKNWIHTWTLNIAIKVTNIPPLFILTYIYVVNK